MRQGGRTARKLAPLALIAVLVVIGGLWLLDDTTVGTEVRLALGLGGGGSGHHLQLLVPEATEVIPGERMVAAGETVGFVTSATVTKNYEAHLVMQIDNSVWPLPADSTLTLRMGGTIKYTDRFIEIAKGHSASTFSDDAYVPAKQFVAPVEYDSLFNTFNAPTRAGLQSFMNNGGQAIGTAEKPLRAALGDSAPALEQVNAVFKDLGANQQALSTLVSSTDQVVRAVATSNPGLQQLLTGAANTFTALSSQSTALQNAISAAPDALYHAGHALDHLSNALDNVATLSGKLSPGLAQLRSLASPLNSALGTVVNVEPDAVSTLNTVRSAAPSLDSLLTKARTTLMPRLQSISKQAAKQVDCIRPYTPSLIGLLETWGGFWGDGTQKDKFLHGAFGATVTTNDNVQDSAQVKATTDPFLEIDYPAVPGEEVDQPWYQPQCGITANDLNVADDPEAGTFDPNGGKEVPYTLFSGSK